MQGAVRLTAITGYFVPNLRQDRNTRSGVNPMPALRSHRQCWLRPSQWPVRHPGHAPPVLPRNQNVSRRFLTNLPPMAKALLPLCPRVEELAQRLASRVAKLHRQPSSLRISRDLRLRKSLNLAVNRGFRRGLFHGNS